jgi:hypothetical protein
VGLTIFGDLDSHGEAKPRVFLGKNTKMAKFAEDGQRTKMAKPFGHLRTTEKVRAFP